MEVYGRELTKALRRIVEDPNAIADWEPGDQLSRVASRVAPLMVPARYLQRYIAYQWRVRSLNAEINHIVDHGYGHLAFSLNPRRTVVTFHDAMLLKLDAGELPNGPRPRMTILGHRLSLRAIKTVARVIADSENSRQDFLRFVGFDPDRVITIPLGLSDGFQPAAHPNGGNRNGSLHHPPRLLHVGHCGFYKNIEGILRAIPEISRSLGSRVLFQKAGGPFTPDQRALISRLHIEDQVQHLGAVSSAQLRAVYEEADLFLMPSWYEGFGLPALEAMACGTPVVASTRGSLPEVVGDAGLLVDPGDASALAEAVVRTLTDGQLRKELRRRGLERVGTFTWERTAQQTLAVYRAVHQENG